MDDDFYPETKTKKTRGAKNMENGHPFEEGMVTRKLMSIGRTLPKALSKRVVTPGHGKTDFLILFIL